MDAVRRQLEQVADLLNLQHWQVNEARFLQAIDAAVAALNEAKDCLVDRLANWSLNQRRRANQLLEGGIATSDDGCLDELESQVTQCVTLACQVSSLVERLPPFRRKDTHFQSVELLQKLTQLTTVVSSLSSQIVRTDKKFEVTLRILAANSLEQNCKAAESRSSGISVSVDCFLVHETELRRALASLDYSVNSVAALNCLGTARSTTTYRNSTTTSNNGHEASNGSRRRRRSAPQATTSSERRNSKGHWSFTFKPTKSTSRRHSEDGGDSPEAGDPQSVTATKWALLFDVVINFRDFTWKLRAHSMPVVLITNVKQQCESWLTVFWDNAFSADSREQDPFRVPESVPRNDFLIALQQWFQSRTDGKLHETQLSFLALCLPEVVSPSSLTTVTRANPELQVPFWHWFFRCTSLIQRNEHLKTFWRNGWIHGFVSYREACCLLMQHPEQTLIRFSTTKPKGGISLLRFTTTDLFDQRKVVHKYGCWNQDDFDKLDFFTTLCDLGIDEIVPSVNWINQLGLERNELCKGRLEEDDSGEEFVRNIPSRLRRCTLDFFTSFPDVDMNAIGT